MKFCAVCHNMLYVNVKKPEEGEPNLVFYCKACGYEELQAGKGSICIVDDNKINDHMKYAQYINANLKHDPTLPRMTDMACPEPDCPTAKKGSTLPNEIIYMNYNPADMKYVYFCCHCNHSWVNEA